MHMMCISILQAQELKVSEYDLSAPIPTDPTVKIGQLDNGLTYYIKRNTKPEKRAELRLVVNAGSMQESEDQLGLAHFVEHMAFNGTKNFEKNDLIDYLQSIGVEFGADLNASTGFDKTLYKLSVPTDDETVFNTSLQVLRDWAGDITFSEEEIDNERGVIAEELRARSGAGMRMYYQSIPILTNNSRYAERLPIGTLDIIMNSKYEALRRFYKDWYRPDLMALVLVGDFNPSSIERKIKEIFNNLRSPQNPRERILHEIPEHNDAKIGIITDTEATSINFTLYYKQQTQLQNTLADYRSAVVRRLYTGMLRQRLSELLLSADVPLLSASAGIGNFLGNMDCYFLRGRLKENDELAGIQALLTESERARRYGFTATELERYKSVLLNQAKTLNKEAGKISSRLYVTQYADHYLEGKSIVGEAFNYGFYQQILPTISLEEVNQVGDQWIRQTNVSAILNAPERLFKELPNKEEISSLLKNVRELSIDEYEDDVIGTELMPQKPKPGNINETTYNKRVNVTTWELDNGITVLAKPTDLQNDLISMSAFRPGGSSLASNEDFISARYAGNIVGSSGVNGISDLQLKKMNMGKSVSVRAMINYYDELFSGSSSSENLERMLQMTHLYFTHPNKDRNNFNTKKNNYIAGLKNLDSNPNTYFNMKISEAMSNNHPRAIPISEELMSKELNLDVAYDFYKKRFASANGFTFIFVGSFDLAKLKKLVSQYLGSLPSNLEEESNWKDIGLRYEEGKIKKTVVKGLEDKSQVDIQFVGKLKFSLKEKEQINLLAKILKMRLTQEMREKMAGVYGVLVTGFATDKP